MDVPRSRAASSSSSTNPASAGNMDIPGASTSYSSSSRIDPGTRARREREKSGRPKDKHLLALRSIRDFLRGRSSYDVLPVSFRLIVLDTKLVVKPALDVMWQAGVVSAPLWQSTPHELLGNSSSNEDASQTKAQEGAPSSTDGSQQPPRQSPAAGEAGGGEGRVSPKSHQPPASKAKAHQLSGFAGMLTVNDIIHLIQYYYHHSSYDSAAEDVEKFRLERLRDIEQALNVPPPPLLSVHPLRPLFDACQLLIKTHARRLPLLDYDEQTGMETVVSVLTQYRVLKFIAMNCRETGALWRSLRQLNIGTYCSSYKPAQRERGSTSGSTSHCGSDASEPGIVKSEHGQSLTMSEVVPDATAEDSARRESDASQNSASSRPAMPQSQSTEADASTNPYHPIATATLDTTVFDIVHMFSERGISAVPILDEDGNVVDLYETVDVITLVRTGAYTSLDLTIRQALERRPPDFSGVWTCSPDDSLASIFALLRKRRVHRLLVLEPEPIQVKASDFGKDKTTPLEELDLYVEDLVEEEKQREAQDREEFLNNPKASLEERLEKGDPVRKTRGRLVGIVCLSDILRYVIGEQRHQQSQNVTMGEDGVRSRGTSIASSNSHQEPTSVTGVGGEITTSPKTTTTTTTTTLLNATQTIPENEPLEL